MHKKILRVILAYKRRFVRKIKRRSPTQRLKSRLYYRTHKAKIRLQRRRYTAKNKLFSKTRKMFKRSKPSWLNPKKSKPPKSSIKKRPPIKPSTKRPLVRSKPSRISKPPKRPRFKAYAPKRK